MSSPPAPKELRHAAKGLRASARPPWEPTRPAFRKANPPLSPHTAPTLQDLYARTKEMLLTLGDDVQFQEKKLYFAFRRIKNFACIEVQPKNECVIVYAKSAEPKADEISGFIRDVTGIGHWGTGNLEITLRQLADLERARPFLERSYEAN